MNKNQDSNKEDKKNGKMKRQNISSTVIICSRTDNSSYCA